MGDGDYMNQDWVRLRSPNEDGRTDQDLGMNQDGWDGRTDEDYDMNQDSWDKRMDQDYDMNLVSLTIFDPKFVGAYCISPHPILNI